MSYLRDTLSVKETPQSEPIPGEAQVVNSAGGYVYAVDDFTRLMRFLILGTEGGTYYATQRKLTLDNAECVKRCIAADGLRTVDMIRDVSISGRAPKNDQAILALALCLVGGDAHTKRAATKAVLDVCRIGTHLFQLVGHIDSWKKWNRTTRRAVAQWYESRSVHALARQMVKYQNREGWSHHDVMHMSHPTMGVGTLHPADKAKRELALWAKNGWPSVSDEPHDNPFLQHVWAFERAKTLADKPDELVALITQYGLPREAVPTAALNSPRVWASLLADDNDDRDSSHSGMPMTAMIRNLGKMTNVGLFDQPYDMAPHVVTALRDVDRLRAARVHPIALLVAARVYAQGHGEKGSLKWTPNKHIINALDEAFYLAFKAIEPTGKRRLLALDVSGSMGSGTIAGCPGITPRVGVGAMALVTLASEANTHVVGFTSSTMSGRNGVSELAITPNQRLEDVCNYMSALPFGGTDCSLPMLYALDKHLEVDSFEIYTDNETWAGNVHPMQALRAYRWRTGIPAKLAVIAMTATNFSIADPTDAGSMNFCGFDTAAPQILADFVRA